MRWEKDARFRARFRACLRPKTDGLPVSSARMHEKVRENSISVKKNLLQIRRKFLFYWIMIKGIGIDLIEKARVRDALERWGRHFSERILTDRESVLCGNKGDAVGSIAARFAAKEAVLKALGTGWTRETGWKDIEILSLDDGSPEVILHRGALSLAAGGRVWLSLSHSHGMAAAMAVIEAGEDNRP
jgi:holo-[acyl-carrier protein] synthase